MIAYDGYTVGGLPRTKPDLMRWATAARNRGTIPNEFRHDRSPTIELESASDPGALETIVGGFEGQLWVATELASMRSRTDFVGRIRSILERAGLTVTLTEVHKDMPPVMLPSEAAGGLVAHGRTLDAAEALPGIVADKLKDPKKYDAKSTVELTAGEKAGKRAIDTAIKCRIDAATLANDDFGTGFDMTDGVSAHCEDVVKARAKWLGHWTSHAEGLVSLRKVCEGRLAQADADLAAPVLKSEAEAGRLTRKCFEALGFRLGAPMYDAEVHRVISRPAFEAAAATVFDEINMHCQRVYGDTHGTRRAKGARELRSLVAAVATPLKYVGAKLVPQYATENDRKKAQNCTGYKLRWDAWCSAPPGPIPKHPDDRCGPDVLDDVYEQ
jgi:hypothetical protein